MAMFPDRPLTLKITRDANAPPVHKFVYVPVFFTDKVETETQIHDVEGIRRYAPKLITSDDYEQLKIFMRNHITRNVPFILLIPKVK